MILYLLFCFWNDGKTYSYKTDVYETIRKEWDEIETRENNPGKCVVSLTYKESV